MPLVVAHLDLILLFTIIFAAFIYVIGCIYDSLLYPEVCWTTNDYEGAATSRIEGFIVNHGRPTLHDGLLDHGHYTPQNQRRHVNDTQNAERLFIEISDDSDSNLDVPPVSPSPILPFEGK